MHDRRRTMLQIALVAMALSLAALPAPAEDQDQNEHRGLYRLEVRITEMKSDAAVNTRDYSLRVRGDSHAQIRTGNRVPVVTGERLDYLDVGLNVDARIAPTGDHVGVEIAIEIDSFAAADAAPDVGVPPVIRTVSTQLSTALVPGKATRVGSIDDVMTGARFVVQLTITPIE